MISDEFKEWFKAVRHATHWQAWQAGREDGRESLKREVIAMLEQDILLDRDHTIKKISEAVEDL